MLKEYNWVNRLAWLGACVALLGVLFLAIDVRADLPPAPPPPPATGFQKGATPFNNPYEDDEEDFADDEDLPPKQFGNSKPLTPPAVAPKLKAPPLSPPTGVSVGGSPNSGDEVPEPKMTSEGIEVGGKGDGIVSRTKPSPLQVNTETGAGSKELVTDFNFPDVDILDLAKTMGKLTGKNFIVDKEVKGRVSIISNSAITVGDAWKAFLTALDMNQYALIPSGSYIRIAKQRDARDKQLKTYVGENSPDSDALITRVFALKYINAEEVARTFRSFLPANSRIMPYEQTNTVIVTDTGSNIAKLAKMLEFLDVEGYDAGIEVISVKFASASSLAELIDKLLPGTTTSQRLPGGPPRPSFGGGAGGFTSRRTKEGGIINTIIADERTNNLIVHANTRGADQVRELVAKLDKKMPLNVTGGKVHVVYLQFADAETIAATINSLSAGSPTASSPTSAPRPGGGLGVNPNEKVLFEGAIKVSADKTTNSLVVTASPSDFSTLERVIAKLDIHRDEVYVEVIIMEMSLQKDFQFSSSVALPTSGVALTPNTDLFDFIQSPFAKAGAIMGFKAGKESDIKIGDKTFKINSVMGLVKAVQGNSNANVLATPQILTLDNEEATFESSERIPVEKVTSNQGVVQSGTEKENVTLSITIKPQINKISNFVKLNLNTKLADISNRSVPSTLEGKAFATIERNAKTTILVADGDTVVLGGLIRDKKTDTVSKVPILGDIPLLGWLFRAKQSLTEKTNLFMFITPKIIRKYENIRAILDKKLKQREDFANKHMGGDDPFQDSRDEMIRSLPDMKGINSYNPKVSTTIGSDTEAIGGTGSETGTIDEPLPDVGPPPQIQLPDSQQAPVGSPAP